MVSQGWCVVSWKICVGLKVITPIVIDKLTFLLLIRTVLSKSFIIQNFLLIFNCFNKMGRSVASFLHANFVH